MTSPVRHLPLALAVAAPLIAGAQPSVPNSLPPARPLGPVRARAAEVFGSLAGVRALPGGRVLVNDGANRRVLLFDSTLATFTVVADTTAATGNAYSGRAGGLIPYRGDSTLFVDPQSLSMLVIEPSGKLGRTMSVPRSSDAAALLGLASGTPGFDAQRRLVYRAVPRPTMPAGGAAGSIATPTFPDSAALVRADLTTRRLDTLTFVRVQVPKMSLSQSAEGRMSMTTTVDPLPVVDDWAVLSDGTVAVLRGRDFHADLAGADGVLRAAPRMPHDWQRLSDEQKIAFVDSTRAAIEKQRAEMQAAARRGASSSGSAAGASALTVVVGGLGGAGNGEPPRRGGPASATGPMLTVNMVAPSELPDYKPPFAAGAARADGDGRLWVRLIATKPMPGPVYAIIDREGKLVDRVVLPPNSAIAGFGPGGSVYLGVRDPAGVRLERALVR